MSRKKAEIPKRMTVWLNIYDAKTDDYAREIFPAEHLALAAAGPNADHVAIPCTLIPAQVALQIARFSGAQRVYQCAHCQGWHLTTATSDITEKRMPSK